jgi:hypothetical protein
LRRDRYPGLGWRELLLLPDRFLGVCDETEFLEPCGSLSASNVPLLKKEFDQLDQYLRFTGIYIDDQVYVGFHVGADISDAANMIDGIDNIRLHTGGGIAGIGLPAEFIDFIDEPLPATPQKSRMIP